jgi:hypothetical protein
MAGGGNRRSREAIVATHERERQVVQVYIRGMTWFEIGRQLGMSYRGAQKAFDRAVKRILPKDVELLRKLQSERMTDARRRLYLGLSGREAEVQDPENPGRSKKIIVRPGVSEVAMLIGRLQDIDDQEADLYGLRAPAKVKAVSTFVDQTMTYEELDRQWGRLNEEEQDLFMTLMWELQGRWVEPVPSIETTTASVEPSSN